ncbi:DUF6920 family protein [Gelidibacter gilvus]|uniref:Uncharacterized protein n=1 Tax=Gelidibacter gilvus TaxID=59602 RepID=A0A4Q0XCW8_9FLAO|nr:DUF6544 family protein [Gelidibacter gilvus]RXJ45791.1 hypothetical protein ESZ48_14505 [Gelidibacter gilvus]
MRLALILLIGIHGIIHLFGFLEAFGFSELNVISEPISKTFGIASVLTFIFFASASVLLIARSNYWWICGMLGVILSQVIIINFWDDAKFGTILNLIIFISAIIAYSTFSFKKTIGDEITKMIEIASTRNKSVLSKQMISKLPPIVQTWLLTSGAIGKEPIYNVYLEQNLQMRLKPDQKDWSNAKAKQYFTIEPPAFNWSVNLKMNPLLDVVGRDKFENGQGEMTIKMLSLFSIANAKNNQKVNQATLQRYLAEIVWFPSSALSPYVSWETIDEYAAKGTMEYKGTKGSGVFHFDNNGNFKKFVAMRYKDVNDAQPTEWTVTAIKTEAWNGIKIPVELKADWTLENGPWTWLKLKITDIKYNVGNSSDANNLQK